MSKRIFIVIVAVVAAFLASNLVGVTDSEGFWHGGFWRNDRNIPINWKVSGTIVGVQAIPLAPEGYSGPALMIDAFLKGAPDRAQFRVLAAAEEGPPGIIPECEGPGVYFAFDDMVIIFEDLSMLFAEMDPELRGWNCFSPDTAVANMVIIGGTGKYSGAEGHFQGNFKGFSFEDSGVLKAETGTIIGEIVR